MGKKFFLVIADRFFYGLFHVYQDRKVRQLGGVKERLAEEQADGATATFAGGYFWCTEPPFEKLDDVLDPGYEEVSAGGTGHF